LHARQHYLLGPLTRVANRRAFFDRAEEMLGRTTAGGLTSALIIFDLDRFKEINDTCGHQAGDRVLLSFCELAQTFLRPGDLFGRFGGGGVARLPARLSLGEALRMAERIRVAFAGAPLALGAAMPSASVSVGVAMSSETEQGLQALFAAADRALYAAKAKGRNRVEAARKPLQVIEAPAAAAG